ncbi:MAG: RnfABCDGE type electron transport complex subunit G [Caldiserica bacterium]|nr:RnfABCDGE type electron transport complex subunit G [Caldisericota bacterium]
MNYRVKMILTLLVVGAFSGGSLSFVYNKMLPKIEANLKKEIENSLLLLVPAASYKETSFQGKRVFVCRDKAGEVVGYAIIGKGGGFQGEISLLIALDKEGKKILGIDILESQETPGLGAKIDEPFFKKQFKEREAEKLEVIKGKAEKENDIEAITGATISSRAVVSIVNNYVAILKEFVEQNR